MPPVVNMLFNGSQICTVFAYQTIKINCMSAKNFINALFIASYGLFALLRALV